LPAQDQQADRTGDCAHHTIAQRGEPSIRLVLITHCLLQNRARNGEENLAEALDEQSQNNVDREPPVCGRLTPAA
jgi:hypothetical protein